MTFWIVAAALLAVALIILILPILRQPVDQTGTGRQQQNIQIAREKKAILEGQLSQKEVSQSEYDSALVDLQTSLAIDLERGDQVAEQQPGKWAVVFLFVLVPVLSIAMYLKLGEYRVIDNPQLAQAAQRPQAQRPQAQNQNMSIEEMLERVKQRLQDNPEDAQGWFIMGTDPFRNPMTISTLPSVRTRFAISFILSVYCVILINLRFGFDIFFICRIQLFYFIRDFCYHINKFGGLSR